MLYLVKKTVLTGAILSILSPWGLAQEPDQTIHWNQLVPKLDDIANAHDLDLEYLLENYFSEYDGEDFRKCMDNADRARADEMRICDAAPSHFDRDLCRKEVSRDYDNRVGVCSMVGERESQSSNSGCTQGGNQTHNEVNVRNSGNNNGNKTSSKPRRR